MCNYWTKIKLTLKEGDILHITRNNTPYKFVEFKHNRRNEEVLKYSIPMRNGLGNNYKSVSQDVLCKAKRYYDNGKPINTSWFREHYPNVINSGGCNVKIIQGILSKVR